MPSKAIIVESPTKARTISRIVGKDYIVKASNGHIRDLPKNKLGVDVDNGFQPEYVTIKGKSKILKELRDAVNQTDEVLLGPDPDREGEAIAWHLADYLGKHAKGRFRRLSFYEVTREGVTKALANPGEIDMKKVDAQQARRVMDRLVGYQVSPFLWTTVRYGLSAGRVQTVALRLICEREDAIVSFKPREYWSITANLKTPKEETFQAKLHSVSGKKVSIPNEKTASSIVESLKDETYTVVKVTRTEKKRNPVPPFTTSTLQQEAFKRLRFSGQRTMAVAQQLYEGVDVGEGTVGLITYMRTDSTRLSSDSIASAREFVGGRFGNEYVPSAPRVYRPAKAAQDAHEAIRPTSVGRTPESVKSYLSEAQARLYELIWRRFVACQMRAARFEATSADIKGGAAIFRATGSVRTFDGFLKVYGETDENGAESMLPRLEQDQSLELIGLDPKQHFTEPPPRYTEATLVKALEDNGIGRPSTYSTIVSTILGREYVERDRGKLRPTELGLTVSRLLVKVFPNVFNVDFTALMESELDRVETGESEWDGVVKNFYGPFRETLSEAESKKAEIKKGLQEESDVKCEKCGRTMVKKFGRNGPFLACPGYPECKSTKPIEGEVESEESCDKCGAPMVIKRGRYGRFLACSRYPDCKNAQPLRIGVECPKEGCDGEIVEKQSKRGRVFYGCNKYPDCDFAAWDRPVAVPCPNCGAPFMLHKVSKTGGEVLRCQKCKHQEKI
jgi:DNA topoisomerase-1